MSKQSKITKTASTKTVDAPSTEAPLEEKQPSLNQDEVDANMERFKAGEALVGDAGAGWNTSDETWKRWFSRTFAIFLLGAIPAFGFGVLFTDIGYGADVFEILLAGDGYATYAFYAGLGLLALLYLFDFTYWKKGFWITFRWLGITIVGLCMVACALLSARDYAAAPIAAFLLAAPLYFWAIYHTQYQHCHLGNFLTSLSFALFVLGSVCLGIWLVWVIEGDKWWNEQIEAEFNEKMQCEEDDCLAGYLLWYRPNHQIKPKSLFQTLLCSRNFH